MDMRNFAIPEMFFDRGSIDKTGDSALRLGVESILIVGDEDGDNAGWLECLTEKLRVAGISWICFKDDPDRQQDVKIEQGVQMYQNNELEGIIAIGGSRSLEIAKGIGAVVSNGGSACDYDETQELSSPLPPLMFVTAIDGSGADSEKMCHVTGWISLPQLPVMPKGNEFASRYFSR